MTVRSSSAETVEGSALSLESVDDVDGGDGLSLGVLSVGDGVTDDVLEESLEDGSGLVIDSARDSLDTTSSGESSDGRLGDTKDAGSGLARTVLVHSLAAVLASDLAELTGLASVDGTHLFFFIYYTFGPTVIKYNACSKYLRNLAI